MSAQSWKVIVLAVVSWQVTLRVLIACVLSLVGDRPMNLLFSVVVTMVLTGLI